MLLSDKSLDQQIGKTFVASWEMVRQVPVVTIDFRNGEKLERTLKGNTVLYLCTPEGKVIDAWPGVYTPADILPQIQYALTVYNNGGEAAVAAYHRDSARLARGRFTASKMAVESSVLEPPRVPLTSLSKSGAESTVLERQPAPPEQPNPGTEPFRILFEQGSAQLLDLSAVPMTPAATIAALGASNKNLTPKQLGELAVKLDSETNLRSVRPLVHAYLASFESMVTPRECRDDFFKKLLHIDIDDPWLGLKSIAIPGTDGN